MHTRDLDDKLPTNKENSVNSYMSINIEAETEKETRIQGLERYRSNFADHISILKKPEGKSKGTENYSAVEQLQLKILKSQEMSIDPLSSSSKMIRTRVLNSGKKSERIKKDSYHQDQYNYISSSINEISGDKSNTFLSSGSISSVFFPGQNQTIKNKLKKKNSIEAFDDDLNSLSIPIDSGLIPITEREIKSLFTLDMIARPTSIPLTSQPLTTTEVEKEIKNDQKRGKKVDPSRTFCEQFKMINSNLRGQEKAKETNRIQNQTTYGAKKRDILQRLMIGIVSISLVLLLLCVLSTEWIVESNIQVISTKTEKYSATLGLFQSYYHVNSGTQYNNYNWCKGYTSVYSSSKCFCIKLMEASSIFSMVSLYTILLLLLWHYWLQDVIIFLKPFTAETKRETENTNKCVPHRQGQGQGRRDEEERGQQSNSLALARVIDGKTRSDAISLSSNKGKGIHKDKNIKLESMSPSNQIDFISETKTEPKSDEGESVEENNPSLFLQSEVREIGASEEGTDNFVEEIQNENENENSDKEDDQEKNKDKKEKENGDCLEYRSCSSVGNFKITNLQAKSAPSMSMSISPPFFFKKYGMLIYTLYFITNIALVSTLVTTWILTAILYQDQEDIDILSDLYDRKEYEIYFGWSFHLFLCITILTILSPVVYSYFGLYSEP